MAFVSILVGAVLKVFNILCSAYFFIVIASCIVTWVSPDPYNPIVRFLRSATEPVFWRIRKYMPFVMMRGIDLSPFVLLIALQVLQEVINQTVVLLFARVAA